MLYTNVLSRKQQISRRNSGLQQAAVYAAVALSLASAAAHLWVMPEHLAEWWGYGLFFAVTAMAQGLYGGLLLALVATDGLSEELPLRRLRQPLLWLGIAGNLALLALYIVTRTAGIPFVGPHAWHAEAVGRLDLLTAIAEVGLIFALVEVAGAWRQARRLLAAASVQALGVGLAIHLRHLSLHGGFQINSAFHWLLISALSIPASLLAVWAGSALASRPGLDRLSSKATWALVAAFFYALVNAPMNEAHGRLFAWAQIHAHAPALTNWLNDSAATLGVSFLLLLGWAAVFGTPWETARRWSTRVSNKLMNRAMAAIVALVILAGLLAPTRLTPSVAASPVNPTCAAGTRHYDVAAISVPIPYNRWGDVNMNGQVFVLQSDKEAVRNWYVPLNADPALDPAGNRRLRPRPLVLRANIGECVEINFTNELNPVSGEGLPVNPRASMHVQGASYNVQTSDGSAVGYNADTTVAINQSITYLWRVPAQEGLHLIRDNGSMAGSEADGGSNSHGLYGALVVEPAGSTWTDPVSGAPLYTGTTTQSGELYIEADIHTPGKPSFRESVQLSQDEIPGSLGMGFNYGSEPLGHREVNRCPDCVSEETWLSSWPFGDPALIKLASGLGPWLQPTDSSDPEDCGLAGSCYISNVFHSYPGDPAKIRYGHTGPKETHIFHLHAHQWLAEPLDVGAAGSMPTAPDLTHRAESPTIDSQTMGPGEMFTADILFGAGSKPGTVGDSIFHCHLYPHFAAGFWSLWRIHDVIEDGTGRTPDGIKVRALQTLPAGSNPQGNPPLPTPENPGFPRFIPGEYGWRAPQPPLGISEPNGNVDDPATLAREDLTPATRIVAGQALPNVTPMEAGLPGAALIPGAPLRDPCPAGSREITYNVSVMQWDVVYNEAGWHDPQARFLVLNEDVDDIVSGAKNAEPLFFRVNAGDCINFNLTNLLPNWVGNDAYLLLNQTNMVAEHIHLVKFDVLASDGSSNGWNYQQAAYTQEQMEFDRAVLNGTQSCSADESAGACRIPMPAYWDPLYQGIEPGQTIHERWYADYELRTVFTHDHHFPAIDQNRGLFAGLVVEPQGMDIRDPQTGEYFQPINDPAHGAVCGPACNANADGTRLDIIGPGPKDDFREYSLAYQDFVPLVLPGGNPQNPADILNPPSEPEVFPDDDPGVMGLNYRNAPFVLRDTLNGQPVDPAYRFSSYLFGDPQTPLLQAYAGDSIRFRLIQGAQEEQHAFVMHGMRWRQEPDDPQSPYQASQSLGISEAFNFEIPTMNCGVEEECVGDHLYGGTATDDLYLGIWGIFRVYGRGNSLLLPLPDNVPANWGGPPNRQPTGAPPPRANKPGTPCPPNVPTRKYDVVAMELPLVYNEFGDHDPYGLIYALAEDEAALLAGTKKPEPLVIRANEGECIEVTLSNHLTNNFLAHNGLADGDASLPLEPPTGTPAGLRVSLHPQLVLFDVRGSDGATVGYNRDQTVGPGESILYRWYADDVNPGELGAINLTDYGDIRGHRHHGLFAGLNIEPYGATYHDPLTGQQIRSGVSADIRVAGMADFREFTLFFQDGLNLRDSAGVPIPDPIGHPPGPPDPGAPPEPPDSLDPEDEGEKGFNYGSASFMRRLGVEPMAADPLDGGSLAHVFSSVEHGDPWTPIFRAYAGDPVRMRVLQGADKPRQHSVQLSGHAWFNQPGDPGSTLLGTQGGFTVGRAFNIILPSAGGPDGFVGDFRYNCGVFFHHLSGGLWGIMRVYEAPSVNGVFQPDALLAQDNPHQLNYHPIMPLELSEVSARVFDDSNMNGVRGQAEGPAADTLVEVRAIGGALLGSATTSNGWATFQAKPGVYDLVAAAPADWQLTTPATNRVDAGAENAHLISDFGLVQLGDMALRIFADQNGSQLFDEGMESGLSGWTVTLTGGGSTRTAVTDANGFAFFDGLKPGNYTAKATALAGWFPTRNQPVPVTLLENASLQPPQEIGIGFARKAGLSVKLFNDSNGNGAQDAGESSLGGWRVTAVGGPVGMTPITASGATNASGVFTFDNPDPAIDGLLPGEYTISAQYPNDWTCSSASTFTTGNGPDQTTPPVACPAGIFATTLIEQTTQVVTLANANPNVWVVAEPFNDTNRDGARQAGESRLTGWTASLYAADGTTLLATKLTGESGRAVFYPFAPGTYVMKMTAPATPPGGLAWTGTSANSVTSTIIAGETGTARFGFVQLNSVGVMVFEDVDKDRIWDADEVPLANRNVRLYAQNGTTLLAQGVTDANGRYAFGVTAGKKYQLQVLLPTGWTATTPLNSNGKATTKIAVTAPITNTGLEVLFGQHNPANAIPASPTFTPAGGTYTSVQSVTIKAATGNTIRYTLDGSDPTSSWGTIYGTKPVSIGQTTVLKAVAVSATGKVSAVKMATYTINLPPPVTAAPASPTAITMITGTAGPGDVSSLAASDGNFLSLNSSAAGTPTVNGYVSYTVPTSQRNLLGLTVDYEIGSDLDGFNRAAYLYNFQTASWEMLETAPQTLAAQHTTFMLDGDLKRFMSSTGQMRLRIQASHSGAFHLQADLVTFTITYQP
jgi:hypothetical protein